MSTETTTLADWLLRVAEDEAEWSDVQAYLPAAVRAIVEIATSLAEHDDMGSSTRDDGEAILRALATIYADREGYRELAASLDDGDYRMNRATTRRYSARTDG